MKKRFEEIMRSLVSEKNNEKMQSAYNTEQWVFAQMVRNNPTLAQKWVEKLEATQWHNYLTKDEAEEIVAGLINQDGNQGGKWSLAQFEVAVNAAGGKICHEPYYNKYALWATANMLYSDHAKSASEYIKPEHLPEYFYKVAVEQLCDKDRPMFVREYFHL